MSGQGRDKEKPPTDEGEATDQEAQEVQPPSPFMTGFCPVSAQVPQGRVPHRAPKHPLKAREPQPPSPLRPAGHARAAERWERWERVPSQFEILAAILADDLRTFVAK